MSFDSAIAHTLKEEGGYADNPNDKGGRTNFGVIQRTYDRFRDHIRADRQHVKLISMIEVYAIYYQYYWLDSRSDDVDSFKPILALIHFDTAVNQGVGIAARHLQKAVDVKVDGRIGPITLGAIETAHPIVAARKYLQSRMDRYMAIIDSNRTQRVFKNNWTSRTKRLAQLAGVEIEYYEN